MCDREAWMVGRRQSSDDSDGKHQSDGSRTAIVSRARQASAERHVVQGWWRHRASFERHLPRRRRTRISQRLVHVDSDVTVAAARYSELWLYTVWRHAGKMTMIVVVVQCLPPDERLAARRIPLQRSRSSVNLAASVIVSPVHSMMSSVQRLRCWPRLLFPGAHPWINSFSRLSYFRDDDSGEQIQCCSPGLPEVPRGGMVYSDKLITRWSQWAYTMTATNHDGHSNDGHKP